jgi:predicted nucleotidyltransferase
MSFAKQESSTANPHITNLANHIERQQYAEAEQLLSHLLGIWGKRLIAEEQFQVLGLLHRFACQLTDITPAALNKINALYEKAKTSLSNFSSAQQLEFYLAAGDIYLYWGISLATPWQVTEYCWQTATYHYTTGLQLAERATASAPHTGEKKSDQSMPTDTIFLSRLRQTETIALIQLRLEQPTPLMLEDFEHFTQRWHSLVTGLIQLNVPRLYERLIPWTENYLRRFAIVLRQTNNNLGRFSQAITILRPTLEHWLQLRQTDLIQKFCHCITEQADKQAKHFTPPDWLDSILAQAHTETKTAAINIAGFAPSTLSSTPVHLNRDWLMNSRVQLKIDWYKADDSEKKLAVQQTYTDNIKRLVHNILENIVQWLGAAPCGFAIVGFGSIARGDFSLTSDLDMAILIEREDLRDHSYFQTLLRALRMQLSCLGDSNTVDPTTHDVGHLQLDSKDVTYLSKVGDYKFINTPGNFIREFYTIETLNFSSFESYALLRPIILYANDRGRSLLPTYQRLLLDRLGLIAEVQIKQIPIPSATHHQLAINYLREHQKVFEQDQKKENKEAGNNKMRYLVPFTLWCHDFALFIGMIRSDGEGLEVNWSHLFKGFSKHSHMEPYAKSVQTAWTELQHIRLQQQWNPEWKLSHEYLVPLSELVLRPLHKTNLNKTDLSTEFLSLRDNMNAWSILHRDRQLFHRSPVPLISNKQETSPPSLINENESLFTPNQQLFIETFCNQMDYFFRYSLELTPVTDVKQTPNTTVNTFEISTVPILGFFTQIFNHVFFKPSTSPRDMKDIILSSRDIKDITLVTTSLPRLLGGYTPLRRGQILDLVAKAIAYRYQQQINQLPLNSVSELASCTVFRIINFITIDNDAWLISSRSRQIMQFFSPDSISSSSIYELPFDAINGVPQQLLVRLLEGAIKGNSGKDESPILSKDGRFYRPIEIFHKTGIIVEDDNNQYKLYTHKETPKNSDGFPIFGFCYGTNLEAKERGFKLDEQISLEMALAYSTFSLTDTSSFLSNRPVPLGQLTADSIQKLTANQ